MSEFDGWYEQSGDQLTREDRAAFRVLLKRYTEAIQAYRGALDGHPDVNTAEKAHRAAVHAFTQLKDQDGILLERYNAEHVKFRRALDDNPDVKAAKDEAYVIYEALRKFISDREPRPV